MSEPIRPTPPMPVVNLHAGDRVLLLVGTGFTKQQAEDYLECLRKAFPEVEFTFVVARQALVLHPEPAPVVDLGTRRESSGS